MQAVPRDRTTSRTPCLAAAIFPVIRCSVRVTLCQDKELSTHPLNPHLRPTCRLDLMRERLKAYALCVN